MNIQTAGYNGARTKEFCNRGRGLSAASLKRLQATPLLQTSLANTVCTFSSERQRMYVRRKPARTTLTLQLKS